ncbi:MAG: DUF4347 domain-containing protein [Proteobacteria bacterium]|nr:DUF4347 domain-containing protein [Pseudomonadota bacterium]
MKIRALLDRIRPQLEWLEPRVLHSVDVAAPFQPDVDAGCVQVRLLEEPLDLASGTASALACVPSGAGAVPDGALAQPASGDAETRGASVAFIDASLTDRQTLADGARSAGLDVVWLDSDRSGLVQIAQALEGRHDLDALHLLTHAQPGVLQLGTDRLDLSATDEARDRLLESIGAHLTDDGDLLVYGCDFGAGTSGHSVVATLARLTRADVAASTDPTGHQSAGGDWILESVVGTLDSRSLDLPVWLGTLAAPVLDLDGDDSTGATGGHVQGSWIRGSGPVTIVDGDGTISDPDSASLTRLTGRFLVRPDGNDDVLSVNVAGTGLLVLFDVMTGELQVTGNASVATYQQVLRTLSFNNANSSGSNTTRVIEISVSDGADTTARRSILLASSGSETLIRAFEPTFDRLDSTSYEISDGVSRGMRLGPIGGAPSGVPETVRLGVVLSTTPGASFGAGDTVTLSLRQSWAGAVLATPRR